MDGLVIYYKFIEIEGKPTQGGEAFSEGKGREISKEAIKSSDA